MEIFH